MRGNHRKHKDLSHCRPHCSLASHVGGVLVRGAVADSLCSFLGLVSHCWRIFGKNLTTDWYSLTTTICRQPSRDIIGIFDFSTVPYFQVVQSDGGNQVVQSAGGSTIHSGGNFVDIVDFRGYIQMAAQLVKIPRAAAMQIHLIVRSHVGVNSFDNSIACRCV